MNNTTLQTFEITHSRNVEIEVHYFFYILN